MSRHYFDCELALKVRVIAGYNRPLREFFLQVAILDDRDGMEPPMLYASIDDPYSSGCLEYFRTKLEVLGLSLPATLFREIARDEMTNAGNRSVRHFADGSMEELPAS